DRHRDVPAAPRAQAVAGDAAGLRGRSRPGPGGFGDKAAGGGERFRGGREMSCGKPHETPCTEVLDRVYSYLDGELDAPDIAKIRQHLDECGPCLAEYGLDELVKQLVHKHCGQERVTAELPEKVLIGTQQVKAELIISQGEHPPLPPPLA